MIRHVLILVLLANNSLEAKLVKLNIGDANRQNKIKAEVRSLGRHQGYCLNLSVQNLSNDSLEVVVEAGRRFVAGDALDQDILLVKQELLVLRKGQSRSTRLRGYCCQASDRSPSANERYTIGNLADSGLFALAQRLNAQAFESDIEQQAIWALSDNRHTSTIPSGKDSCALELKKFVALLKREPIPWYLVEVRNRQYSNGVIEQYPTWIAGTLHFSSEKKCYGTFSIVDSAGTEVAYIKSEWFNAGSNQVYPFRVPAAGLKKGRYLVQISAPGATLVKRELEI